MQIAIVARSYKLADELSARVERRLRLVPGLTRGRTRAADRARRAILRQLEKQADWRRSIFYAESDRFEVAVARR